MYILPSRRLAIIIAFFAVVDLFLVINTPYMGGICKCRHVTRLDTYFSTRHVTVLLVSMAKDASIFVPLYVQPKAI